MILRHHLVGRLRSYILRERQVFRQLLSKLGAQRSSTRAQPIRASSLISLGLRHAQARPQPCRLKVIVLSRRNRIVTIGRDRALYQVLAFLIELCSAPQTMFICVSAYILENVSRSSGTTQPFSHTSPPPSATVHSVPVRTATISTIKCAIPATKVCQSL